MHPVSPELIAQCIKHGTRTSIAYTKENRELWQWKHKYMLNGLHVITEPWTNPAHVVEAYWVVKKQI